ncbi:alpha/beta hydrolase [Pseudothauera rhizosphaerae]|uniref:Alpha/beta hydrolase n=1 Tax=Pseudothauera rhizosphaerae TaxID=2565932 RepID=A0A4V3WAV0_9RHOO|nr:alpha/beta hydrolase-fold protein [Pseudothauera rhizosphaerae]THF60705.1 alpha/beta hydrolase [Pseudothauera rhizosphaerae]
MTHPDLYKRRGTLLGLSALALLPVARALAAEAGERPEPPRRASQTPAETIVDERVESFALNSPAHNGEPWQIHLARPRGAAPAAGYRALYLLDGNASFPLAWHALAALRTARPELAGTLDQLALVGIGYPSGLRIDTPRRYHDFTPYTAEEFRRARSVDLATGGRQVFLDFLAQQVREAVARRLPIDARQQTLFGHSLGGLFTMHVLYTRPELFRNYVATDPSFWWNGSSALQEQAAFLAGVRAAGGKLASPLRLLVENSGGDAERADRQTPAASLAGLDGLQMWHRNVAGETHGSLFGPAAADAVLFAVGQVPQGAQRL